MRQPASDTAAAVGLRSSIQSSLAPSAGSVMPLAALLLAIHSLKRSAGQEVGAVLVRLCTVVKITAPS